MKSNGQANDGDDFRDKSGVSDPLPPSLGAAAYRPCASRGVCPPHEGDINASKINEASLPLVEPVQVIRKGPILARRSNK